MATLIQPESVIITAWALHENRQAAAQARELIRNALAALPLSPELLDDAVLMTSELAGNAVLYGEPPYELILRAGRAELYIEVVDAGTTVPIPCALESDEEHGRGLAIIAELAGGRCGHHQVPYITRPGRHGKAVWFAIPVRWPVPIQRVPEADPPQ